MYFNPKSLEDMWHFEDELYEARGQVDVMVNPEADPGRVACLFARVAEHNKLADETGGGVLPKIRLEGVSYNTNFLGETMISFVVE